MEKYYKKFYENSPIGFFSFCIETGKIIRMNPAMMLLLGNPHKLEVNFFEMFRNPKHKEWLCEILEHNNLIKDVDLPIMLPNGEKKWLLINGQYCEGCDGDIDAAEELQSCPYLSTSDHHCQGFKCVEGTAIDITLKKSLQGAIQKSKEEDVFTLKQIQQDVEKRIENFNDYVLRCN